MAAPPQKTGRAVTKNHHEAQYRAARAQTAAHRAVRHEHPAVARKLGEMVRWHDARRARYRGQGRRRVQGLWTGIVVNAKWMVTSLGALAAVRAGRSPGPASP